MKIETTKCDRCGVLSDESDEVTITHGSAGPVEAVDLCARCTEDLSTFLSGAKLRVPRKPKEDQ